MKLECTKNEFVKLIIACKESTSCYNCALQEICTLVDKDKGIFIAEIAEIVPDKEEKHE